MTHPSPVRESSARLGLAQEGAASWNSLLEQGSLERTGRSLPSVSPGHGGKCVGNAAQPSGRGVGSPSVLPGKGWELSLPRQCQGGVWGLIHNNHGIVGVGQSLQDHGAQPFPALPRPPLSPSATSPQLSGPAGVGIQPVPMPVRPFHEGISPPAASQGPNNSELIFIFCHWWLNPTLPWLEPAGIMNGFPPATGRVFSWNWSSRVWDCPPSRSSHAVPQGCTRRATPGFTDPFVSTEMGSDPAGD